MDTPILIVVGGPNGSGKSTFALNHSNATGIPYIGADQIASELSPDDPVSARIEASRQFIIRIRESITQRDSLIIESTLAGKSLRSLITDAKHAGYAVTIFFVFLDSADSCVERVKQRVKLGGHDVPEVDIRRRFIRAIANFWSTGNGTQTIVRVENLFEKYHSILESND